MDLHFRSVFLISKMALKSGTNFVRATYNESRLKLLDSWNSHMDKLHCWPNPLLEYAMVGKAYDNVFLFTLYNESSLKLLDT